MLVVDSHQGPKSGKFVDQIGSYDPKSGTVQINTEKAKVWMAKGAQVSATVHNMLVSKGVINAPKKTVQAPKKEAPVAAAKEEKGEEVAVEEVAA